MRLYINIDHVATVRQARRTIEPDPVRAAVLAELGGADGITVHHRIDIRHVSPRDVELLMRTIRTGLNLEVSSRERMVDFAVGVAPMAVTLVPESRQEVTTEGGLDLGAAEVRQSVATALKRLADEGIRSSLFIDPDSEAIDHAAALEADAVELHTGEYANGLTSHEKADELERLAKASEYAHGAGLAVHAGHGLTYENVVPVAALPRIEELNIGHSVVSRAIFTGLERAVRDMRAIVDAAPSRVARPGEWVHPIGF